MAFPKIGKSRLENTIPSSFSSFYLTLIAMIQGVVLSSLATTIPAFVSPLHVVDLLSALWTLATIIIVWHEYVLSAQEFWWKITWLDSMVPFLLGIGEFLMIDYLGKGPDYAAWFFSASFTAGAGFIAYINYGWWLRERNFEHLEAFELFKHEIKRGRILLILLCIYDSLSACCIRYWSNAPGVILLLWCFHGGFLTLLVYKRLAWQRKSLKLYGINEET